jgi:hypothetical protein
MKRDLLIATALLLILTIAFQKSYSQATEARISLDTSAILLGDQIDLTLALDVPANSEVFWPFFTGDTVVTGIEILSTGPVDTISLNDDYLRLEQAIKITCFDSGYYQIPPIPFKFRMKGDTTNYMLQTIPAFLEVSAPEVDMNAEIKPIKPPLEAPFTLDEALPYIGGVLLLGLLVFGILYYLRKRKKEEPVFRPRFKPDVPAHIQAMEQLEALKMKKLWQSGKIKEYYSELTEIVRWYVEERYKVPALEMTTGEIVSGLKKTDVNAEALTKLDNTLILADLVKFAKEKPLPVENDVSLNNCIDFVKETKPQEQTEEKETEKPEKVSV